MVSRVADAVERAGRIDRAHRQTEAAKREVTQAYTTLLELDPEAAASLALAIMDLDKTLTRTARL